MSKTTFRLSRYFPATNIVLIITSALLLLAFIFFSNYRTTRSNIRDMEQREAQNINSAVTSVFDHVNTVASALSLNTLEGVATNLTREEYLKYNSTQQLLNISLSMNEFISGITVFNDRYSMQAGSGESAMPDSAAQYSEDQILKVYGAQGNRNALLCILEAQQTGHALNDVYIVIDTFRTGDTILQPTNELRCELVVDRQGNIVISDRSDYTGKNVFALFGLEKTPLSDRTETIFAKGNKIVSWAPLHDFSLYAFTVSDSDYYLAEYNTTMQESAFLAFLLICIVVIVCLIISKIAYRPIQKIIGLMNKFSPVTESGYINDMDYINDTITSIYSNNAALSRTVDENIAQLKKQQLAALQAQISPHFLFNTLDAVNWVAIDALGANNDVSQCIIKTKRILRSGIDIYHFFASLAEEISCSSDCLDILKIRYGIDFKLLVNLTEKQLNYRILKNSIQPILENAVYHGFANMEVDDAHIEVSAKEQEDTIRIMIKNNGVLLSKKELEDLTLLINSPDNQPENHVGLRNVHHRLQLLFGKEYGLSFSCDASNGFVCTIYIPIVN